MKYQNKIFIRILPPVGLAVFLASALSTLFPAPEARAEAGPQPATCEEIGGKKIPIAKKCVQAAVDATLAFVRNSEYAKTYDFSLTESDQAFLNGGNYGTVCSKFREADFLQMSLHVARKDGRDTYFYNWSGYGLNMQPRTLASVSDGPEKPEPGLTLFLEGINEIGLYVPNDLNPATCSAENDLKLMTKYGSPAGELKNAFKEDKYTFTANKRFASAVDESTHSAPSESTF